MVVIFFSASICQPRFVVITVPADGLAPVGARPSTGAVMINGYVAIWGAVSTQWHRFTSTGIPTTKVLQNGVASALSWKWQPILVNVFILKRYRVKAVHFQWSGSSRYCCRFILETWPSLSFLALIYPLFYPKTVNIRVLLVPKTWYLR